MSWNSKVIWSEGMLLQPQHLQQHDRYLHTQLEARNSPLRPYAWGVTKLDIDQQQLALGKLAIQSFSAIMPDGTAVGLPVEDQPPPPLDIPADARDVTVVLALPVRRHGLPEVDDRAGATVPAGQCASHFAATIDFDLRLANSRSHLLPDQARGHRISHLFKDRKSVV